MSSYMGQRGYEDFILRKVDEFLKEYEQEFNRKSKVIYSHKVKLETLKWWRSRDKIPPSLKISGRPDFLELDVKECERRHLQMSIHYFETNSNLEDIRTMSDSTFIKPKVQRFIEETIKSFGDDSSEVEEFISESQVSNKIKFLILQSSQVLKINRHTQEQKCQTIINAALERLNGLEESKFMHDFEMIDDDDDDERLPKKAVPLEKLSRPKEEEEQEEPKNQTQKRGTVEKEKEETKKHRDQKQRGCT